MFENMSYEYLLERMLDRIPDNIDKREGSIIYDALAPAAMEVYQIYIALDMIIDNSYADTASWEYLVKRAAERGIFPYPATKAVLQGKFSPLSIEIPIGSRFNKEEYNYQVIEKEADGIYLLECEEFGEIGNNQFGSITPIDYIKDLKTSEITNLLIPGEDDEDEESIRNRYYASMNSQAFGGNIADYKEKVNKIAGVGGVKIERAWKGGGTARLTIIGSDYKKPSSTLIDTVQMIIDPEINKGEGYGIAPIGHHITVDAVKETVTDITTEITYQAGWDWNGLKLSTQQAIDTYFHELAMSWEDEDIVIRISQIETRLLNLSGVLDIANTKINGASTNMALGKNSIAIRGKIND